MKTILTVVTSILAMALTLALPSTSTLAADAAGEKIRIIDFEWPPYFLKNDPENKLGIAKEMFELCIPDSGLDHEFSDLPIKRMFSYLKTGELDISVIQYRKDRESFVHFGEEPVFESHYTPVVRANSGIAINNIKDFENLMLGHIRGLVYSPEFLEYTKAREKDNNIIAVPSIVAALELLQKGRIDTFVNTQESIYWAAKENNMSGEIEVLDFSVHSAKYYLALSKESKLIKEPREFLNKMDRCFIRARNSGKYKEILSHYE